MSDWSETMVARLARGEPSSNARLALRRSKSEDLETCPIRTFVDRTRVTGRILVAIRSLCRPAPRGRNRRPGFCGASRRCRPAAAASAALAGLSVSTGGSRNAGDLMQPGEHNRVKEQWCWRVVRRIACAAAGDDHHRTQERTPCCDCQWECKPNCEQLIEALPTGLSTDASLRPKRPAVRPGARGTRRCRFRQHEVIER